MKNKINLQIYLIFTFLIFFMTACMDPVIDKDDSYSDFEAFDASDYLNDPNDGFINGGFEEEAKALQDELSKMQQQLSRNPMLRG